jgi:hypothetical protein
MLSEFCPNICPWADITVALRCLRMGKIDVITYKYVIIDIIRCKNQRQHLQIVNKYRIKEVMNSDVKTDIIVIIAASLMGQALKLVIFNVKMFKIDIIIFIGNVIMHLMILTRSLVEIRGKMFSLLDFNYKYTIFVHYWKRSNLFVQDLKKLLFWHVSQ